MKKYIWLCLAVFSWASAHVAFAEDTPDPTTEPIAAPSQDPDADRWGGNNSDNNPSDDGGTVGEWGEVDPPTGGSSDPEWDR